MKIRARPDLTEARDELVRRWKELTTQLEGCRSVKDLEKLLYTLKAARCDEAIADLVVALEQKEDRDG